MIVLDTHAWIYFSADAGRLRKAGSRALKSAKRIGVPAIGLWELTMLVEKRRITLDRDLREWIASALSDPRVEVLPMTPPVVLAAHFAGLWTEIQGTGSLRQRPSSRVLHSSRKTSASRGRAQCPRFGKLGKERQRTNDNEKSRQREEPSTKGSRPRREVDHEDRPRPRKAPSTSRPTTSLSQLADRIFHWETPPPAFGLSGNGGVSQ